MDENPFMISHSIDSSPEVKEEEKSFREEERSMGSVYFEERRERSRGASRSPTYLRQKMIAK